MPRGTAAGFGLITLACIGLTGPVGAESDTSEYGQGYALVYQQANQLKNVDKLLIVKGERESVTEVTDEVVSVSGSISSEIESFVASRESIELDQEVLPSIEAGARDRMGLDIAGELLFSFGCDFEQKLLFSQAIATLRMLALSQEMEDEAPDDEQQEFWAGITAEIEPVFGRVRELVQACENGD